MSSTRIPGRHRRPSHKGGHRKPGKTAQTARYAGAAAATGVMVAGLALPAGASTENQVGAAHMSTAAHAARLHYLHIRHLEHLEHLRDLRVIPSAVPIAVADTHASTGIYSYAALEALWRSVGGSPAVEATAACIAEHESGGNPDAISPTDDWGLMQINASWGPAMATLNPVANMEAAVKISYDGTDWNPWTTAPDCV